MVYEIALVGTGPDPENPDTDGYAMAYRHAKAYERLTNCRIAACVDVVREHAEAFAREHDLAEDAVYTDIEPMLRAVRPDIVSVCVPPTAHLEVVATVAESGVPKAIHCEKPMATTWEACRTMVDVCDERDVQLTINHQRRFAGPFREAKSLLDDGTIGDLRRIELGGDNLYDYGTHLFDMCGYYTNQAEVEWVMGQIDYRTENVQFGVHNENHALAQWRYANGIFGLASTGEHRIVRPQLRLIGDTGRIEVGLPEGPPLRYRTNGADWQRVETGDGIHRPHSGLVRTAATALARQLPVVSAARLERATFIERAIEDVVASLHSDREPRLVATNALQSTELIFAAWESARRRGRVTLPLDIDDNPLEAMVADGSIRPVEAADGRES